MSPCSCLHKDKVAVTVAMQMRDHQHDLTPLETEKKEKKIWD